VRFSHEHLESRHILFDATRSLSSLKYDTNTKLRKSSTRNNDPIRDRISYVIRAEKESPVVLKDESDDNCFLNGEKAIRHVVKGD
jgi:hypothetical protein